MIPTSLISQIEKQAGNIQREDKVSATIALKNLNIPLTSEFAEIYKNYRPANFTSSTSNEYILDVCVPTEQILGATEFIHETWELPERLICFTSLQGEGGYLFDIETGGIFDFDLTDYEDFISGKIPPRWSSFYEFIKWFIS